MDIRFHDVRMLHLLWLLPVVALVQLYAAWMRTTFQARFVAHAIQPRLRIRVRRERRFWKAVLLHAACALAIVALSRPAWNPRPQEVKRRGRDVVFVLDVSRSMMAEDLRPNRLERAKLAVSDCLEVLEGDRVGLVAFAGTAVVRCPLTFDYGFFRLMLSDLQPDSVTRGGTMIGDAVRRAHRDVLDGTSERYRDIVLITDGEDHSSFPVEAARAVGESGVRIIAIGLGDETEGRPIPITGPDGKPARLRHQGEIVRTKLDAETLRTMAEATPGGRYLPVATGVINLGDVYLDLIAAAEKREFEAQTIEAYDEKYQIFLGTALLLLCLEWVVGERGRRSEDYA